VSDQVRPVENIFAAQWRSAVAETLAKTPAADPVQAAKYKAIIAGTEAYCDALSNGAVIAHPGGPEGPDQDSDPEIAAYLAYLHHRQQHDRCTLNDAQVQSDIALQLARFIYGNALWQQMSQQYFANYATYPFHKGRPPTYRSWCSYHAGKGNLDYGVIAWRLPANATVALVGDIGTGTDVAVATLMSVLSFKPDAILHVGDVY
jgi:hypothetical protein